MSCIVIIKVVPGSGKQGWTVDSAGQIKCYLKSQPEKGRANKELVKLLARDLKIARGHITIVGGATSRTKRIRIADDAVCSDMLQRLGLAKQTQIWSS